MKDDGSLIEYYLQTLLVRICVVSRPVCNSIYDPETDTDIPERLIDVLRLPL